MKHTLGLAAGLACLWFGLNTVLAADEAGKSGPAPARIGVYDSRVLAYAHFWSEDYQRKLNELIKTAREAQAAGETDRLKELKSSIEKKQEQNHLQVFSSAPVEEVLAGMKERLPAIQKETGVSRLVSKWDEKTLEQLKTAEKVEVTDQLLREFKLDEKQKKVVESIRKQKPLPLEQAKQLLREGKL